jgi:hypothetical protein
MPRRTRQPGRRRRIAHRAPRALAPAAARLLLLGLACAMLAACGTVEGDDGTFKPEATTNTDFLAPQYVPLGNQPVAMDYITTNYPTDKTGTLTFIAAANNLADPPVLPDGSLNPIGTVTILTNTPAALPNIDFTTVPPQTLITQSLPTQALFANITGGTNPDLVVLDNLNTHVAVYKNTGSSWSTTPDQQFTLPATAAGIAIAKTVSTNTRDDIIVTVPSLNEVEAFVNDQLAGTLAPVFAPLAGPGGRFLARYFDSDNNLDLAVLEPLPDLVQILSWNPITKTFDLVSSFAPDPTSHEIVAGSFTGDPAHPDLATLLATPDKDTDVVNIFANNKATPAGFSLLQSVLIGKLAGNLFTLGSVAGSGSDDIAVVHTNSRYMTYLPNSGSSFGSALAETTRNPAEVVSGDVNGDGKLDVVTVESDRRTIGVFAGDGFGNLYRTQIGLLTKPTFPRIVSVNNVGRLDLLVLEPNEDRLAVFLNAQ